MKVKTKIIICKDGTYKIKVSYSEKGRKTIRYYSAQELGVSNLELPGIDFRSKILERLKT